MIDSKPMELSTLAEYGRITSFDTDQPLRRYLGALRQMMKEAKIYQSEGDYDKAFVYSLKILIISNDFLPHRHPEWEGASQSIKDQIRKDSDLVEMNLSTLKEAIHARNLAWSNTHETSTSELQSTTSALTLLNLSSPSQQSSSRPSTPPTAILTLKESVQPAVMTMSSSSKSTILPSKLLKTKLKEGKTKSWASKFGVGKKRSSVKEEKEQDQKEVADSESSLRRTSMIVKDKRIVGTEEGGKDLLTETRNHNLSPPRTHLTDRTIYPPHFPHIIPPAPPTPAPLIPPILYNKPQPAYASSSTHSFEDKYSPPSRSTYDNQPPIQIQQPPYQLQRQPSRLTISHQQQQGYSPTPSPILNYDTTGFISTTSEFNFPQNQNTISSINPPPPLPLPPLIPIPRNLQPQSFQQQQQYFPPPTISLSSASSHPQSRIPNKLTRTNSLAALPLGVFSRPDPTGREQKVQERKNTLLRMHEDEDERLWRTEGGYPLRNMIVPLEIISQFVALAMENSDKGIETCGLLMGGLAKNTFSVTHLLIPKQEGTQDTCSTTHEEEQFKYQDDRDLMTLGWIHTHPTQTCFMSSLDLHTHASYQSMLAEAIAIVCSPKHEVGFGIFRLTDPPGLETIMKCTRKGLFHPHPDLPIYTNCDFGHVKLRNHQRFQFNDLRNRRYR